jgi:hypothetical protein
VIWLWFTLYALAGVVSVPLIARWMYDPDLGGLNGDRTACVFIASLGGAPVWPIWLALWMLIHASAFAASLIFRDSEPTGGKER